MGLRGVLSGAGRCRAWQVTQCPRMGHLAPRLLEAAGEGGAEGTRAGLAVCSTCKVPPGLLHLRLLLRR
jgi:hypothetical protein